jgi:hypothetical protein
MAAEAVVLLILQAVNKMAAMALRVVELVMLQVLFRKQVQVQVFILAKEIMADFL